MALIDTTNVTNSSILLKSRLDKNMSKNNHYLSDLQAKRDQDWEFRYNVVGIEEEREKQTGYTDLMPIYTPTEVVIRSVKGENGKDLRTDWVGDTVLVWISPICLLCQKRINITIQVFGLI